MKLKNEFITQEIDDIQVMVSVASGKDSFSGIVKSNATAAFIVNTLKSETSINEITDAVTMKYDVERSIAQKDIEAIIARLRSINALEE